MPFRRLPLLALAALMVAGCVPQKKYDSLQQAMNKAIADDDARVKSVQSALDDEKKHASDLDAQIADLSSKLDAAQKSNGELEDQLAGVVKDRSRLKGSVDEMTKALAELQERKAESDARIAEFKGLLDRFKGLIDAGKLKVRIVDGRMEVELASDVLFGSGSATLSKDGKTAIDEISGVLASIPGRKFQVEGHTDNVPIHSATYPSNWELASARALTVVKEMVTSGMPADRVSGASFGEFKPAEPNDTVEGRAANRRIAIVVLPDLGSLPGFDELNRLSSGETTGAAPTTTTTAATTSSSPSATPAPAPTPSAP